MHDNMEYWVWLGSIPGIGAVKSKKLLDFFEDPYNVFTAKELDFASFSFLSRTDVENLVNKGNKEKVKKHIENINANDIKIVTIKDENYPEYLKNIYDPPITLYMKGNMTKQEKYLAVVGSRKATSYGLNMAEVVSRELSRCGITVVSGMARGIDTFAHKGALSVGGKTVAVLGCGLDIVYPYENKKLMENIIENGACLSEFLPGTQPVAGNFPARNRIISGISMGVIVIEAGERSGSLITANFALEQGREVFALPGNVNSLNSTGTNKLIKEGAKMVTSLEDILEEIGAYFNDNNKDSFTKKLKDDKLLKGLDKDEVKIVECLKLEPTHIDIIANKTGLNIKVINSVIVMLELKGLVEQLPGKVYKLKL
ncbi:DNA-processing protein DprA [Acetivibrio cellulolyticus]|uniref:DNA-processing protein DprA n=1 Tax=Acetivibrio cellulolyticus TaxID=35830 RepID=UPI0001E2C255|nr:DNA-processing protein DprA [Acetivibrio cellulolyticus]